MGSPMAPPPHMTQQHMQQQVPQQQQQYMQQVSEPTFFSLSPRPSFGAYNSSLARPYKPRACAHFHHLFKTSNFCAKFHLPLNTVLFQEENCAYTDNYTAYTLLQTFCTHYTKIAWVK